jgi:hypothetical protein
MDENNEPFGTFPFAKVRLVITSTKPTLTRYGFRNDEPMIVLDTLQDWRFIKNV